MATTGRTPLWRLVLAGVASFAAGGCGIISLSAIIWNIPDPLRVLELFLPFLFVAAFVIPTIGMGMLVLGGISEVRSFVHRVLFALDARRATILAITAV